jgi:hypothetical protein
MPPEYQSDSRRLPFERVLNEIFVQETAWTQGLVAREGDLSSSLCRQRWILKRHF